MKKESSVSDFGRDHGLIHEAVVTGRKAGWTRDDWAQIAHSETMMTNLLSVVRGDSNIVSVEHIVDLEADPFVPDGSEYVSHFRGGQWRWDPDKISLYRSPFQRVITPLSGEQLLEKLNSSMVLLFNANLLDFLYANQYLIPQEWKGKDIFFWGTIYCERRGGRRYVRFLQWEGRDSCWRWDMSLLSHQRAHYQFAAIPKKLNPEYHPINPVGG